MDYKRIFEKSLQLLADKSVQLGRERMRVDVCRVIDSMKDELGLDGKRTALEIQKRVLYLDECDDD